MARTAAAGRLLPAAALALAALAGLAPFAPPAPAAAAAAVPAAEGPTYLAHPPAGTVAHPALLILLHGSGADERDMIGLWRQLPPELLVVSPRAPFGAGSGREGGYVWYRKGASREADIAASLKVIDAVIASARERFGATDVVIGGFSQGAVMSYEAALRQPRRYRGAVILSGSLFATVLPAARAAAADGARVPFFIAHGTADTRIPLGAATASQAELESLGEPVSVHRYEGLGHGTSDAEIADFAGWLAQRLKERMP